MSKITDPRLESTKSTLISAEKSALNPQTKPINHPSKKAKFNLIKSKSGPLAAFSILAITVFFIFSSVSSLFGFQLHDIITKITDTQHISMSRRKPVLVKSLLSNTSNKNTFSKKFRTRLAKQGIATGYLDRNGKFVDKVPPKNTPYVLKFENSIITSSNIDDFSKNNAKFLKSFRKASPGRAINFHDRSANHFYRKNSLTRNDFANFHQTGDAELDQKNFSKLMHDKFAPDSKITAGITDKSESEDPNKPPEIINQTDNSTISGPDSTAKAKDYINNLGKKLNSANFGCLALKVGNMISTAINALENQQSIIFFMSIMENISKTKAGSGHNSAIHPIMNFLHKPAETTIHDIKTNKPVKIFGSPLDSPSLKSLVSNRPGNRHQAMNFSTERTDHTLKNLPELNNTSLKTCSTAQAAGSAISLSTLAIPGSGIIKISIGLLKSTVLKIGAQVAVVSALAVLIPTIAEVIFTNRADIAIGQPGGEFLAKGAVSANANLARSGSAQMPGSKEAILAFNQAQQQLLSEENQIANHENPFDLANPSSFFGQLLFSFSTIFSNSFIHTALLEINNSALISASQIFASNTSAQSSSSSYMNTFGDCPKLESVDIAGNIHCIPVSTSDLSTVKISPDDTKYRSILEPNLKITTDSNGETTENIRPNSNLAKFINYCTQRQSPFGAIDANIQNSLQHSLGTIGDNLPFIEDIIDIANAAEDVINLPWTTGSICVNSSKNPHWDSEFKYYQRYIEDNRILEQLGNYEDSANPITAFINNYTPTYQQDNSLSGQLARLTGLTKYDAEGILALSHYQNLLIAYRPARTYQFNPIQSSTTPITSKSSQSSIITHFYNFININPAQISKNRQTETTA